MYCVTCRVHVTIVDDSSVLSFYETTYMFIVIVLSGCLLQNEE